MIAALATRHAEHARRQVARFSAWRAALHCLREDCGGASLPPIESLPAFLAQVPADQRSEALLDLIAEHLRHTWRAGCGQLLDAYFGELCLSGTGSALPSSALTSLIEDEFLARYQQPHGDMPLPMEYCRRFSAESEALKQLKTRCLMDDRFIKIDCIGRGGLAEVWRGVDRHTREQVAIKQPLTESESSTGAANRLAAEARTLEALTHPGIIGLRAHHVPERGQPALIMQWAQGPTLSERIHHHHAVETAGASRQRRQDQLELLRVFAETCDAVAYAHDRGVIHCDLKPGNIIIENGHSIILDWGMASLGTMHGAEDLSQSSLTVLGTPAYMAPEQVEGHADVKTDVFGLGATLFEMLTGRPPREWGVGSPPADWQSLVKGLPVPAPRDGQRGVPKALDTTCQRALSLHAADRHASAAQLASEVRTYLAAPPNRSWFRRLFFPLCT